MISIADTTSQVYKNGQNENPFRDLCIIFFSEIMPEAFYLDRRVISVAETRFFDKF
jgi:hypothetical protein